MTSIRSIFTRNSAEAIPEQHRAEFWQEITFANFKRMRSLLLFAIGVCGLLIYGVNILNVLNLSPGDNRVVLWMHLLLLGLSLFCAALVFARPLRTQHDITQYHTRVLQFFTVGVILGPQSLIYAVIVTKGHPIFIFAGVAIWYSSLRLSPRVSASVLLLLLAGLWAQLLLLSPPFGDSQFRAAAYFTSVVVTIVLILSSAFLFRSAVESFRQRKALEEERNTVAELNTELSAAYLEADTLNQELHSRQEILEHQATEIEIINTQLHEQNEMLMALDIEKNELLAIVSHDLKNPITAVLGLAEMLQSEVAPQSNHAAAITGQIIVAANQMLSLVKNLLDVNRLEAGVMPFHVEAFDLIPFVASAVQQYAPIAEAKQIAIHYTPRVSLGLVSADKQAVVQILDNLLSNAVKYSPYGQSVYVRVDNRPACVRIEIQDEGEGISEDDMQKLFGKFVRLSARPTGGEHSTGLGLSIVKKMVEAMNGRVWCESKVGDGISTGATFIVELPVPKEKNP
ncbi:MAG: HAMP domain-containing histidine kinase [Ignavibacteria bacterium]|nr:HAMP domain-containing histidine kinase [Ignavibacteria bacterium]